MADPTDLELAIEAGSRRLAELRALRERVAQRRLEAADGAVLAALISAVIEQAEPGQEWVTIELPDEEETWVRETGGATSEHPRR
jgi:hypothetical protein